MSILEAAGHRLAVSVVNLAVAGLAVTALSAGRARAVVAESTYLLHCTSGAPPSTGTLDASSPSVAGNLTDSTPPSTFACDAEVGVGDASTVPHIGPYAQMSGTALTIVLTLTNRVIYEWELTPDPNLTVDPATLMVPVEVIGIARARLTGGSFNFGQMTANIFGSQFGTTGIQAAMGTSGNCLHGQLGTVGGQPTCVALGTLRAQLPSGSVGQVHVITQAGFSTNAASTYYAYADPLIRVDPVAEFAPGMRYADFFELSFSPGVVNAVPEPSLAAPHAAVLATLAALLHSRSTRRERSRLPRTTR